MRKPHRKESYRNRRKVPIGLRLKIIFNDRILWAGIILLAFTLFLYIQHPMRIFKVNKDLLYYGKSAKGVVVNIKPTNYITEGKNKPIYKIYYTYKLDNQYDEIDYSTRDYKIGNEVNILYLPDNPKVSQIDRKDYYAFGSIAFVFALMFICTFFIGSALKKSLKTLNLLTYGYIATGKLIKRVDLHDSMVGKSTNKLIFAFKAANGKKYKSEVVTKKTEKLLDEKEEKIIYDPNYPADSRLLDSLPDEVKEHITQFISFFKYIKKEPWK